MLQLYDQTQIPVMEVGATNEEKFKVKTVDGCEGLKVLGYENPSMRWYNNYIYYTVRIYLHTCTKKKKK